MPYIIRIIDNRDENLFFYYILSKRMKFVYGADVFFAISRSVRFYNLKLYIVTKIKIAYNMSVI